jgi:hypothetical protein
MDFSLQKKALNQSFRISFRINQKIKSKNYCNQNQSGHSQGHQK